GWSVIRLILGLLLLVGAPVAAAQTPGPNATFAWLPADVRPEYPDMLMKSAWAKRWQSAVGWVTMSTEYWEYAIAPPGREREEGEGPGECTPKELRYENLVRPEAERIYSCLDDVRSKTGEDARKIYEITIDYHFVQLMPGQLIRDSVRYAQRRCFFPPD